MHSVLKEEGHPVAHLQTLLAMIKGSIGSGQFLEIYIKIQQGEEVRHADVIGNGSFACAYFTSALLTLINLLEGGVHTTVTVTVEDLYASGWYEIDEPTPGAVVLWAPKMASDKKPHRHIGFVLDDLHAVSTDGVTGRPTKHHVTYGETDGVPNRLIEAIFFHELLCQ
ncbi:hypothetical protein A3I99_03875 [Candidatus Kaiserbacteria bacterium RIFCSPLOWO2_02_FULL_45_11b]|uniref:Uncharacterized protein n=1 Tax=Candidatus Kaiserbacteria bacterium RIFCSPLOWO2_12_FULL_45_26 TaxID=1798525 RepID=A0A1F6FH85_9BACT|nr:MAG: hypothetical protein A2Z56_02770 [Candidatus Kaiserbacteria bacterium RIFCSPHIGHO2_12_45_16]OGG70858.1 MAG: hypothetical protein A2929_02755 [Candidatus Kaiserbacteria bacterium RIFCSPLOWO2_01_FULL_45_25]OGG83726.1 MAG: hypothetical protein A3I99_03875 [Candidatus Kaiserbacteria bacterium RIFCSPLOWO2_02_FULL_45_11b]OGG85221.1 MAG: hypothetical protein A3G90_04155 [Candidatus Kaiserbacteria bacterium RIFCSPLOWO2_12_FULL_45_26]